MMTGSLFRVVVWGVCALAIGPAFSMSITGPNLSRNSALLRVAQRLRTEWMARAMGSLSLYALLRSIAGRLLDYKLQWLPAWLLAWPVGPLPEHSLSWPIARRLVSMILTLWRAGGSRHRQCFLTIAGGALKAMIGITISGQAYAVIAA
jgi:hypothetical protein